MVLEQSGGVAGPCKQWPKAPKTKLTSRGPSGSSSLRSDGSCDNQAERWAVLTVAKDAQGESWKTTLGSQGT
jgi:hypothetical protein